MNKSCLGWRKVIAANQLQPRRPASSKEIRNPKLEVRRAGRPHSACRRARQSAYWDELHSGERTTKEISSTRSHALFNANENEWRQRNALLLRVGRLVAGKGFHFRSLGLENLPATHFPTPQVSFAATTSRRVKIQKTPSNHPVNPAHPAILSKNRSLSSPAQPPSPPHRETAPEPPHRHAGLSSTRNQGNAAGGKSPTASAAR